MLQPVQISASKDGGISSALHLLPTIHAGQSEAASAQSMALALTAATASCALGNLAAQRIGAPSASLAFVSVFATIFASVAAAVSRRGLAPTDQAQSPFVGEAALYSLPSASGAALQRP